MNPFDQGRDVDGFGDEPIESALFRGA